MSYTLSSGNVSQSNFDVDFVLSYRFPNEDKVKAQAQFEKLVHQLASVGLATEVRSGEDCSLLLFVKAASQRHLFTEVYRSRIKDWLHGLRTAAPDKETQQSLSNEPLTDAERLRIIYLLITGPKEDGGAGITPKQGEWKNVESLFALHDHKYNKEWITRWSKSWYLTEEDLQSIRDRFGEKIAFYFAFLQSYFSFLLFPAIFGASAYFLLGSFSPIYAVINCLWCIVFTEYWKRQEVDYAVRWGVKGVSDIQTMRAEFQYEKEIKDPVTGEIIRTFPATKRLARQLLQIPFTVLASALLGSLIATCFGIEIFISEVYDGPFKGILVFLPTGILTTCIPIFSSMLTGFANRLTEFENYETNDSYDAAMTQKIFVLNFITSYVGIFLTAFVYVPFGSLIVPYLDIFSVTVRPFANNEKELTAPKVGFQINPDRLRKQVIYFTVTAQVVNLLMEVVVPYLKRRGFQKYNKMKTKRAAKNGGISTSAALNDLPEEKDFLKIVRNEATLDFGYLSLFSVVWPLTAVSFIVNNWIELRSDAVKITVEMQRPTPWRADTIGPWLDTLGFLTWLGSITSAALVYLFSGDGLGPGGSPWDIKAWGLLLTIFFSEHIYFIVRLAVRGGLSKIESQGHQKQRAERFAVRKRYLDETLGDEASRMAPSAGKLGEKVDRSSLEEDARQTSSYSDKDRFWARQRGWEETASVGKSIIQKATPSEDKKSQ
ncbi:MAG: hypothetical protein M1824_003555 [Vezdaea acicularis]|nr:MAG: hypothetical protein M1824_003555 [Vezdaea acicularis]